MICQSCHSPRILSVDGKSSDLNSFRFMDREHEGYVLDDCNIGGGDYIRFNLCMECGQVQGTWPVEGDIIEADEEGRDGDGGHEPPLYPHVSVELSGHDGNAYSIVARVSTALRRAGVKADKIAEFKAEAMSGDYDDVLQAAMRWVDVE